MMNWYKWICRAHTHTGCGATNKEGIATGLSLPATLECGRCGMVHNTQTIDLVEQIQEDSVAALLIERGNVHGDFRDNADHAKRFLDILKDSEETRRFRNQIPLTAVQYNAAVMVCQKLSRILAGDAAYEDHWIDIQGYAKLGQKGDKP